LSGGAPGLLGGAPVERGGRAGQGEGGAVADRSGVTAVKRRRSFGAGRWQGASVAGNDRRQALERRERKRSEMHGRIEDGEGRVIELTGGAAMAAVATNLVDVAVLRRPAVDER
jgi:hypothetical protein